MLKYLTCQLLISPKLSLRSALVEPLDIPLSTLPKFPRLAALLEGKEATFMAEAVKSSSELELNEAGDAVKRKVALPADVDLEARSVFVVRLAFRNEWLTSPFHNSCLPMTDHFSSDT